MASTTRALTSVGEIVDKATGRVRDLPAHWFDVEHSDAEVLDAVFGTGWETSMLMFRGLSTRFWFLEAPGAVVQVSLARDHDIEPYRKGEGPLPARRRWTRQHLRYWVSRAEAYPNWAALITAETRLRGTPPRLSGRAVRFFDHWAHRHLSDPERRDTVLMLAGLANYATAAALVREHMP